MRDIRLALAAAPLALACSAAPGDPAVGRSSAADTAPAPTIAFTADWKQTAAPLVAGEQAQIAYDPARLPTCRGNLGYGGNAPGWSIDASYSVNGIRLGESLGIAGASLLNLHLPAGALPTFTLPFAGELQIWFSNGDVFGCNAWDSSYGTNYRFTIAPPANAPGWVGNASALIDRATCGDGPCDADASPAESGATFDTWARERAAIAQEFFDVWKGGVTDFDNPDLWKELDVQSHRRIGSSQPFTTDYVSFRARIGNDARYAVDLRALDPLPGAPGGGALTSASQCPPIPATITADGQYVEAAMELYFTVNGVAVQPSAGGAFRVLFQNYAGLYAVCSYPPAT